MKATIESLHISTLFESPTNPRKHYDQDALQELADTIASVGIQSPIKVRPLPLMGDDSHFTYEIIFGHRRFKAAKLAGLEFVPCIIDDMSDAMVAKVQIIENLQREDVNPLEEAEGIRALLDTHHITVDELAQQIGQGGKKKMSRSGIYAKLKLVHASDSVKEACRTGVIGSEIACNLARLPLSIQATALRRITKQEINEDKSVTTTAMPLREAMRVLKAGFTIPIAQAKFPIDDANLFPGACTTCKKCSDSDEALAADMGAGMCLDDACFKKKGADHTLIVIDQARNNGHPVLTGEQSRQVMQYSTRWANGYEFIDDIAFESTDETGATKTLCFHDLLALRDSEAAPIITTLLVPHAGMTAPTHPYRWAITDEQYEELIANAPQAKKDQSAGDAVTCETVSPEDKATRQYWAYCLVAMIKAMRARERTREEMLMILASLLNGHYDLPGYVMQAFGWKADEIKASAPDDDSDWDWEDFISLKASEMDPHELGALLVALSLKASSENNTEARMKLALSYDVNPLEIMQDIELAQRQEEAAEQAADDAEQELSDEAQEA
jgi:ParB/RepB/Spo0J family partition protein